ncbi:Transposase [Mesorhizobium muleiense]|uniref:Transposase n=1 Tax=Mesorhizobium muleiense TaxID=1004279 RepID=A0A1G9DNR6_9HYPH|nr:Transposase [Mesorhizobium muleiense]
MLLAARAENERLRQIIKELQRYRFGRRAESLPEDQLLLGLEEAEQVEAEGFASAEAADPSKRDARARKRRANRGSLPGHLSRVEQVIDVADKICPCCQGQLHVMGEDVSERLDIVPAQFRVIVTRRPKYACRACEEVVVQAPAPARLVESGIPTEATVAHVLVSKYADHLPLYRQAQIYARQGVNLDRSTLADWVGKAAFLLRPVHERLFERLKASDKLFADETTALVLDPGRGRTKTGQLVRLCPRRPTLGRNGPTRRRLSLRSGPQGRTADPASSGLCRNPAGRRIRGLQGIGRTQRRELGLLLVARASPLL